MELWTTFCPQKISWEVTCARGKGKGADGRWRNNLTLITESLQILKQHGITGIRLVIYPDELSHDGQKFDWESIDTMLDLCKKQKILVDLCIGPFQYPNYPGIYFPRQLLEYVYANTRCLDTTRELREYGERFLEKQLNRYGDDKRIRGFHFANEWPDKQRVQGKEAVRTCISEAFMQQSARYIQKHTNKPILLNTNIDAADRMRLRVVLLPLARELGAQGRVGFDVYPSQETWKKAPLQKLYRFFEPYGKSFARSYKLFAPCTLFFCEVEAQPWGGGQSWYRILTREEHPEEQVIQYSRDTLAKTMKRYILPSRPKEVSLWGADFWLSAHALGITWPLDAVKACKTNTM